MASSSIPNISNMKQLIKTVSNGTAIQFNAENVIIFGVKNSSATTDNQFMFVGSIMSGSLRGGSIGGGASWVTIGYTGGTFTVTNNAGMYATFMIFYE